MIQISLLTTNRGYIQVYHSNSLLDKRDEYEIGLDSFYKGCVSWVPKEKLGKVMQNGTPSNQVLYISTVKFEENPYKWRSLLANTVNEQCARYSWFKPITHYTIEREDMGLLTVIKEDENVQSI